MLYVFWTMLPIKNQRWSVYVAKLFCPAFSHVMGMAFIMSFIMSFMSFFISFAQTPDGLRVVYTLYMYFVFVRAHDNRGSRLKLGPRGP